MAEREDKGGELLGYVVFQAKPDPEACLWL